MTDEKKQPGAGGALAPVVAFPLAPALRPEQRATLQAALRARHAERTQVEYAAAWERFEAWCTSEGRASMPSHPETIALYLADMGQRGLSVSSMRTAVAAIAAAHALRFPNNPAPTHTATVKEVMRGLSRMHGRPTNKKKGATADILLKMVEAMPKETHEDRRDLTMLLLGFATAMRRSELVLIERIHLTHTPDGYSILIPKSKTDQESQGQTVFVAYNEALPQLCAARALDAWLQHEPTSRFVFQHANGTHYSDRHVARVVKSAAARVGLDISTFSGHSLRRGHITQARFDGAELETIKRQSRHKSNDVLFEYIEAADQATVNTTKGLGSSLLRKK